MAMKKMTGAKKPVAKMATTSAKKGVSKNATMNKVEAKRLQPKAKATVKSRGSNTDKQVGDMNQRENYNANRDYVSKVFKRNAPSRGTVTGAKGDKVSVGQLKTGKNNYKPTQASVAADKANRMKQRAGGKGR